MGVNFANKYQNLVISKSEKNHYKIVKIEVEYTEHLHCKVVKFDVENFDRLGSWYQPYQKQLFENL